MSLEKLVESSWKFYRRCIFREGSLRYFLEDWDLESGFRTDLLPGGAFS